MTSRLNLVILGIQGAGKGTQCKRLSATYGIPHVSTGDILRAAIKDKTPLGREVEGILAEGGLVSDDLVNRLVEERFTQPDAQKGALLDGFPRTIGQAEALDAILGDDGIKLCINLDAPIELVTDRLSRRRVCQECGHIYHDADESAISGKCEKCGGPVIQRADDTADSIRQRLSLYERDTAPLLHYYEERRLLVTLNADQSVDAVTAEIEKVLAERGLV